MIPASVLYMLLGAAAVVLLPALADRIRGIRPEREVSSTRPRTAAMPSPAPIATVKPAKVRIPVVPVQDDGGPEDLVITALVGAGYKKSVATSAARACGPAERQSIETWTAAALRNCARGSAS